MSSFSDRGPNLSLVAEEVRQLLVNQQLVPFLLWPKSFTLAKKLPQKNSSYCLNLFVLYSYFDVTNIDLKWIPKDATNLTVALNYLHSIRPIRSL